MTVGGTFNYKLKVPFAQQTRRPEFGQILSLTIRKSEVFVRKEAIFNSDSTALLLESILEAEMHKCRWIFMRHLIDLTSPGVPEFDGQMKTNRMRPYPEVISSSSVANDIQKAGFH